MNNNALTALPEDARRVLMDALADVDTVTLSEIQYAAEESLPRQGVRMNFSAVEGIQAAVEVAVSVGDLVQLYTQFVRAAEATATVLRHLSRHQDAIGQQELDLEVKA